MQQKESEAKSKMVTIEEKTLNDNNRKTTQAEVRNETSSAAFHEGFGPLGRKPQRPAMNVSW
jgi:hypothetical protein